MSKILNDLGYYSDLDNYIQSKEQTNSIIGRVIKQGRQSYQVKTDLGNYNSKISGKLRHKAKQQSDYPVVGDWVLAKNNQENNLIIHEILPRKTTISRKAINRFGKKQTIAANVDFSFVIQGHVCCTEGTLDAVDKKTNKRNLSVARAKFVYDYFIKNGVDKSRMSYEGLAHKFPLGGSADKDRRVEILIVSD